MKEDVAIVFDAAAASIHLPAYGKTKQKERFLFAAETLNGNPLIQQKLSLEQIQDHYKRFQDQYNFYDKEDEPVSGLGVVEIFLWINLIV